jgi:dual specificity phosphatase 12
MTTTTRPKITQESGVVHKFILLEDDALADLLSVLDEACAFITNALHPTTNNDEEKESSTGRVLVHCLQGISRSGAIVVSYIMKSLNMQYTDALDLARKYRPIITPNLAFAEQLDLWERMHYCLLNDDGSEKTLYRDWKVRRESKLRMGEEENNRERARSVASMAARFGARRMEFKKVSGVSGEDGEEGHVEERKA